MSERNTVEIVDLKKHYGGHAALQGISFSVKKGEVFGLLGPNGAGKTTTINIITGLISASSGQVKILGREINGKYPAGLRNRIGLVFEESNLYKRLSGRDNLVFFANLYGVKRERIEYLLTEYKLQDAAGRAVGKYSKGMKKRLLICRALLHKPELLIMDEPTGGLDPISADIIRAAVTDYQQAGKTVILSTHYLEEADRLCDRVAFVSEGKIAGLDRPENFKRKYQLDNREEITLQDVFRIINRPD